METVTNTPLNGEGTTFWLYTGTGRATGRTPEVQWQRLGMVKDIQPGEMQMESKEDNYLDDQDPEWKQSTPGMKSVADSTITLAWLPGDTGRQRLFRAFNEKKITAYRIKYPNGVCDIFYGFVSGIGKTIPRNETITSTVKFTHSGKPVMAEESIPELKGIGITAAAYVLPAGKSVTFAGNQGARTLAAGVKYGDIALTITPQPAGAVLPALTVTSSSQEYVVVPDETQPVILPIKASVSGTAVVVTVSAGHFSDKVTLTLTEDGPG